MNEFYNYALEIAKRAKAVSLEIASKGTKEKNALLEFIAENIEKNSNYIIQENKKDIEFAKNAGKQKAFIDRLILDEKKIKSLKNAILDIVALPDPVGSGNLITKRPNGLKIEKIRVPIGVIAMIYESRPNVTSDSAALCLKSGNTVILRGGKEAINSNKAIANVIKDGLKKMNFPEDAVILIENLEYQVVDELLKMNEYIDLVIPRGGESLIKSVTEKSTIPVIKHDKGVCHVFIDASADKTKAENIVINAKCQKPSVCNAMETLLIHKEYPYVKELIKKLLDNYVTVVADKNIRNIFPELEEVKEEDFYKEYLDYKLNAKIVENVEEAVNHINKYGSHHSDSIISESYHNVQYFLERVDSAAVYANASTRFTDGGEFGLGAEMGISTQKLHVRGPMGLEGLTTEKWIIYGDGHIRE
ncbi:MAG: glutamate-5-semialdehyde dehydrogenase [Brevinematales bacterium]